MHQEALPYVVLLIISAIITASVARTFWRRRPVPGAAPLALVTAATAAWSISYSFQLFSVQFETTVFWSKVNNFGVVVVPAAWLALALAYTGRERLLTRRNIILLAIEPLLFIVLLWTDDLHHLVRAEVLLNTTGPFPLIDIRPGFVYWFHAIYSYALLLAGSGLLVEALMRAPQVYRGQFATLLLGSLLPWVGNLISIARVGPKIDLTPFFFALAGLVLAWGVSRFRLLDIVPMARGLVIQSMDDGVIVLDLQNRIVEVNPAVERLLEMSAHQLVGQAAAVVLAPCQELLDLIYRPDEASKQVSLSCGDQQRVFTLRSLPFRDWQGRVNGQLLVLHDVTDRMVVEDKLRESERRFRRMASSIQDGVTVVEHGKIVYVNDRMCEIAGYRRNWLMQMTEIELAAPKERQRITRLYIQLDHGITLPTEIEFWIQRGDGSRRFIHNRYSAARAGDQVVGRYVVTTDITARKQAELEREHLLEELDAFAHTVAHDLQSPLALIIGFAETLNEGRGDLSDQDVERLLGTIAEGGHKMSNIINELMLFSGVRKMKKVVLEPLVMADILQEAQRRLKYSIDKQQVEIVMPEEWPKVLGYGPWVEEIWTNYLSNAIKYGGQPPKVDLGASIENGSTVRFWIQDNGPGLTEEQQARLFVPFSRLDQVRAKGHGLGLSIVRRVVERLGGKAGVTSVLGEGSVFYFTLPLQKECD